LRRIKSSVLARTMAWSCKVAQRGDAFAHGSSAGVMLSRDRRADDGHF
jgi:hypothetical protein